MWAKTIRNFNALLRWFISFTVFCISSGVKLQQRRFGWVVNYASKLNLLDTKKMVWVLFYIASYVSYSAWFIVCVPSRFFALGCGKLFLIVDTRLWIVFKIDVVCVRFYMCPFILAKATKHMQQTWLDTSHYERLDLHCLWACISSFTVRRNHWALRDSHHQGLAADISNIVHTRPPRWLCAHSCIVDTHSTLQGGAPVMICVFICTLPTCNTPCPSEPYWTRMILWFDVCLETHS